MDVFSIMQPFSNNSLIFLIKIKGEPISRPNVITRASELVENTIVAKNLSFWYKNTNIANNTNLKTKDNGKGE